MQCVHRERTNKPFDCQGNILTLRHSLGQNRQSSKKGDKLHPYYQSKLGSYQNNAQKPWQLHDKQPGRERKIIFFPITRKLLEH